MKIWSIVIFVFLVNLSAKVHAQNAPLEIPEFKLYQLDGTTPFTNKNIEEGKPTVFWFFDVTCPHCQRAMGVLSDHYKDLKHIPIYLVSLDGKEAVNKFIKFYGSNLMDKSNVVALQDVDHEFIERFQPSKYPSLFLYDKNKKLVDNVNGEDKVLEFIEKAKETK